MAISRLATGMLCLLLATAPARAEPPPVFAFGSLPAESAPALSADGRWVAWLDRRDDQTRIMIFDVTAHRVHRTITAPGAIAGLAWGDGGVLLVALRGIRLDRSSAAETRPVFRYIALDVDGGPARYLPLVKEGKELVAVEARMLQTRSGRPHAATMYLPNYCHCVASVDTLTGEVTLLASGNASVVGWVVDTGGKPVVREEWDFKSHTYRLLVPRRSDEKPLEILRQSDAQTPRVLGLAANGLAVVLLANNGHAHQAAWALPLDGTPMQLLVEDPQADITDVYSDQKTGAINGVYVSGSVTTLRWLDPAIAKRQEALQRLFPDREVWQAGWSEDAGKVLVQVQGPTAPPIYYLVDYATHRADIAAEEYPLLANVALAATQDVSYPARDGTPIPAYLTVPPHASGPSPLVVLPHDGPGQRDYLQFDWRVQFLVSRGYAVLQPQYRGSAGFGDAWLRAGFRQWGGLMQDDVTDGVQAMIDRGVADPRRVCIVGIGYGGYVALAGAAFTPERFRCAVSIDGVSDIPAFVRDHTPKYGAVASNELAIKERIGVSDLAARSPANAAAAIRIPLLVLYFTGDSSEMAQQSVRMADAMHAAGKPVTLDTYNTRNRLLKELEDFLHDNL